MIKNISAEDAEYFDACARIRDISRQRLFEKLIEAVARDQMVLSILDDESKRVREKHKHRWRDPARRVAV